MNKIATVLLSINPILWASFYVVTKDALAKIDPVAFSTLELSFAAVPGLALIVWRRSKIDRRSVTAGIIMGATLYIAVIGGTVALYFTTATNTAFFPALNGTFAAIVMAVVFQKAVSPGAWISAVFSTIGALLLIMRASAYDVVHFGDIIALGAAVAYTAYIFVVDWQTENGGDEPIDLWVTFGIELLTMAGLGWITFVSLGFRGIGNWTDTGVVNAALFIGIFTTVLPSALALFYQRFVPPITVAFLYVLEPVWGAVAAAFLLGERLTPMGYFGGALIVLGSLISTVASVRINSSNSRPTIDAKPGW